MKKKKFLSGLFAVMSVMALGTSTLYAAEDTVDLDNSNPAAQQGTTIDLNIESEATVKIPKNISFNINAGNNDARFNETTNCYEYYMTVSASGNVMDAESVFIDLEESSLIFVNKNNPNDYIMGDIFYHNVEDDSSYDLNNLEGVWNKTLLEDIEETNRQKTLVITIPSEVVIASGQYQATVNFNVNKGTEPSAIGSWSTIYKYRLVGNGDAVILGFADSVDDAKKQELETLIIPKKIKTSAGVYAPVVGVEAGAFKDNTYVKTLKIPADCALSVTTSAGDGSTSITTDRVYVFGANSSWGSTGFVQRDMGAYYQGYKSTISDTGTTYEWRDPIYPKSTKNNALGSFMGCTNLDKVYLTGNINTIGKNTFKNCTNLKSIEIPASCKWVGAGAFIGCPNLNIVAKGNTTKYATFVEYITNSYDYEPSISVAYNCLCTVDESYINPTTNILDSALTGIVFDSGISRRCTA